MRAVEFEFDAAAGVGVEKNPRLGWIDCSAAAIVTRAVIGGDESPIGRPDAEALGQVIRLGNPEAAVAVDGDAVGIVHLFGVVWADTGFTDCADGADRLAGG